MSARLGPSTIAPTLSALYGRFFNRPDAAAARALFIDSGAMPGSFRLTALPSRAEELDVEGLEPKALLRWLKRRLPRSTGDGRLHSVLLAYDAGRNLEDIGTSATIDPQLPDVLWAQYDAWLESESADGPYRFVGEPMAVERLRHWVDAGCDTPVVHHDVPPLKSTMRREDYERIIHDVLQRISRGELYQANIARRLQCRLDAGALPGLYWRLRQRNPAQFGALWAMSEGRWLASNSPECLFEFDPMTRWVHSYPIKGTRPRGASETEDAQHVDALRNDPKERAEHVMIVDLVRNDLGRVCEPGSVGVETLFGVRPFPTLHHMISDVRGRLRPNADLPELIGALFPGGSITGAPKVAAMQCIEELESLRRGYYCGSLLTVGPTGAATANILIRTLVAADGMLYYQSGGGIVADSDPALEWRETEVKAHAITSL